MEQTAYLGIFIKKFRRSKNIAQLELARSINLEFKDIVAIENNRKKVNILTIIQIERVLCIEEQLLQEIFELQLLYIHAVKTLELNS